MKNPQINRTVYKVSDFVSWQKSGSLDLTPPFQRRSVWKKGAKSYLIDTIIRGLPIPIIFIRDKQREIFSLEPLREVVDGQQRLRTLLSFISPQYLKDFKPETDDFKILKTHNKNLANKVFKDLDNEIKQMIMDYQFSVHVLPSEISDREILQIFARMNSTGTKLNRQELRNAGWFGEFKTSVYDSALKYLDQWRNWKVFNDDNISRMDEVDLTTEFYSLMLKGLTSKSQNSMDDLYDKFENQFKERNTIEKRFEAVMDNIDLYLGNFISNSIYKKKTLFYILFLVFYNEMYGLKSVLNSKIPKKITLNFIASIRKISDIIENNKVEINVVEAASRRTTNLKERKILYTYFLKKLNA